MKNILIIRVSALGDLVTFEPLFRILRDCHKDVNITFLTSNMGKELYSDTNYFNEIEIFSGVRKSVQKLKSKNFDIVLNLQCTTASHFVTLFLNKKVLINRNSNLLQKLFGMKSKAKSFEKILHECNITEEKISIYKKKNSFYIQLPAKKIELLKDKKVVAISTGSSPRWVSKRWGEENFNLLIQELIKNSFEVVLIGSELETDDAKSIVEKNTLHVKDFVNKTTLSELKSVLKRADLYIGNDSGPSHVAAAVGTNTVTIFGSTSEKHCVKNWPYFGTHECITPCKTITCHPCYKSSCFKKNAEYMQCMKSISVTTVANIVLKCLKTGE